MGKKSQFLSQASVLNTYRERTFISGTGTLVTHTTIPESELPNDLQGSKLALVAYAGDLHFLNAGSSSKQNAR